MIFFFLLSLVASIQWNDQVFQPLAKGAKGVPWEKEPFHSPLKITQAQMNHYVQKQNTPNYLRDVVLSSLARDSYGPLFKGADEHTISKMADPMQKHVLKLVFKRRMDLHVIFANSKIPASEIDSMLKYLKLDIGELANLFEKFPLDKAGGTRFREAFRIYSEAVDGELPTAEISDMVKNSKSLLSSSPYQLALKESENAFRNSEMELAIANRKFLALLHNAFRMNQKDFLPTVKERLNIGYLATLTKEWIPLVTRKDQILLSSVVLQIAREEEAAFSKAAGAFEKTVVLNSAVKMDKLEQLLQNRYGQRAVGLMDHLKSLIKLQSAIRNGVAQRLFYSTNIKSADIAMMLSKLDISAAELFGIIKEPLNKRQGVTFQMAYKLFTDDKPVPAFILRSKLSKMDFFSHPESIAKYEPAYRESEILLALKVKDSMSFLRNIYRSDVDTVLKSNAEDFRNERIQASVSSLVKKWLPDITADDEGLITSKVIHTFQKQTDLSARMVVDNSIDSELDPLKTQFKRYGHDVTEMVNHLKAKMKLALFPNRK